VLLEGRCEESPICTFYLCNLIATFEKDEGWHGCDFVHGSDVFGRIDITLQEVDVGILLRKLLEDRGYGMAGPTPCCMEVNNR